MENFKISKGATLYITQRLLPTPQTHSMVNAILRTMHISALFRLDGGGREHRSSSKTEKCLQCMIDHTASIWLVGCPCVRCRYQLSGTFDSACLGSIIVNDWAYSHTPKWLSWLVILADNDGSGLVCIRLRLSIHFSFFAFLVCLRGRASTRSAR